MRGNLYVVDAPRVLLCIESHYSEAPRMLPQHGDPMQRNTCPIPGSPYPIEVDIYSVEIAINQLKLTYLVIRNLVHLLYPKY